MTKFEIDSVKMRNRLHTEMLGFPHLHAVHVDDPDSIEVVWVLGLADKLGVLASVQDAVVVLGEEKEAGEVGEGGG